MPFDGSGEAVSPAARERFDARDGEEGEGRRWSLGRGLLPPLPPLLAPLSFFLLLAPSPTAEGGASPERAREKAGRMGYAGAETDATVNVVLLSTERREK